MPQPMFVSMSVSMSPTKMVSQMHPMSMFMPLPFTLPFPQGSDAPMVRTVGFVAGEVDDRGNGRDHEDDYADCYTSYGAG